jgi:leucine dehydrogenase
MVFDDARFAGHERVVFGADEASGLRAIVAIHSTRLGVAVGGCRMLPYRSESEALRDVLRLSRSMTRKTALAGLAHGGGKAVILADPREKSEALLLAFGRLVDSLGGDYVTAEDVNMGVEDVRVVARATPHATGIDPALGADVDPGPFTAHSTFVALRAAVRHHLDRSSLEGLRVAVQGLGNVGLALARELASAGAELVVADVDASRARRAGEELGARVSAPEEIVAEDVDVFAPCALGGVLDDASIPRLRARVVAGGANDQLAEDRHGDALFARGILYAPDFACNPGGVINGCEELSGSYDRARVLARIDAMDATLSEVFARSRAEGRPPHRIADELVVARLAAARA